MSESATSTDPSARALQMISCKKCNKLLHLHELNKEICSDCEIAPAIACRGCRKPIPKGHDSSHCPQCDEGRRSRWVTSDTLRSELGKQNDKLNALSEQQTNTSTLLAQILEKLNADSNNNNSKDLPSDVEPTAPLTSPRGSNDGHIMQSPRCSDSDEESGISYASPSYSELSMASDHESYRSGEIVKPSPGSAAAGSEQQLINLNSEDMEKQFKNTKLFSAGASEAFGLKLSKLQEESLGSVLLTETPAEIRSYKDSDRKDVPVHSSAEKFFNTLKINESINSYISQSREKKGEKKGKATIRTPILRAIEKDSYRVDVAVKMGLRHCVKAQWLLTDLKQKVSEGSQTEACDIVDKVFESLFTVGQQASRASVINNQNRRRVYLNELGLRDSLVDKAMILPMDKDGKQIFGGDSDIEAIITDFDAKDRQLNKATGAFKRPLQDNRQSSKQSDKYSYSYKRPRYDDGSRRAYPRNRSDNRNSNSSGNKNNASSSRGRGKRHF